MNRLFFAIIGLSFILFAGFANGQNPIPDRGIVFNDSSAVLPKIFIELPSDSLSALYQPGNEESDHLYPARFIYDDNGLLDTLENVGFRFRGNTSRYSFKKSFKISFNTFVSGREFHGLEKMNLNGEHNDPSIIRSKLCFDLLRSMEIPAPRANHVELYANGLFLGLYINVEHIDEEFVHERFGNKNGNLYRCLWPADLNYITNNPNAYKLMNGNRRVYELKTNQAIDDYSDLADFIDVLNNISDHNAFRCALEEIFNVEDYLKVIAFDILTGNWDGPIYNKNNFYLYKNTFTGKFEYIPFDLDNTIGIDFLNRDWVNRNIYNWSKSNEQRPIFTRLMDVAVYRDWFSYFMQQTITDLYNQTDFFPRIDATKNRITAAAMNDTYRTFDYGFTVADFNNSYNSGLGNHVVWGLKEFITDRGTAALNQVVLNDIFPIITQVKNNFPSLNTSIDIQATVEDEMLGGPTLGSVVLNYRWNGGSWLQEVLFDDGMHNDGGANDGIFGTSIPGTNSPGLLEYNIEATDQTGQTSTHPFCNFKQANIGTKTPLFINEFMAQNTISHSDNVGEFDDWIEIYNGGNTPIYLGDKFLTDNLSDPTRWQMPDLTLPPNEYLLLWADGDGFQGPNHTNFKLDLMGESLGIFHNAQHGFAPIDTFNFGLQQADATSGRLPNGLGPIIPLPSITPGFSNVPVSTQDQFVPSQIQVFPNPFSDHLFISFGEALPSRGILSIRTINGQLVYEQSLPANGKHVSWDGHSNLGQLVSAGVYTISVLLHESEKTYSSQKIILIR